MIILNMCMYMNTQFLLLYLKYHLIFIYFLSINAFILISFMAARMQ